METPSRPAKTLASQWLHGFLDLCLLGLLEARRDYGYELGQRLAAAGFDDVPGGTLYPALLRLERQALVAVSWESSASGPRRKYYDLTDAGRHVLAHQLAHWRRFSSSIDAVATGVAVPAHRSDQGPDGENRPPGGENRPAGDGSSNADGSRR